MNAIVIGVCTDRERQCVRASNYPFVKLMEIAVSVHTGRVRQCARCFQATRF